MNIAEKQALLTSFLQQSFIRQRKKRASGETAGCSFAYGILKAQCTNAVRIIAPSEKDGSAAFLLPRPLKTAALSKTICKESIKNNPHFP